MADTQETIADIIAEMDRVKVCADGQPCLSDYARRFEAAHKRERGDCAKLREAVGYLCERMADMDATFDPSEVECLRAALAAPPRNCDVGTPEEQYERYKRRCKAQDCCDCPVREKWDFRQTGSESCQLVWAQMPYEEGGEG